MRILPIDALPGAPLFVAGVSIVRGAPLPVISVSHLFGDASVRPNCLVVARVGTARVGLAVDEVVGVQSLPADVLKALPPLLGTASIEAISEMGALDGQLMLMLDAARTVPADV